MHTENRCNTDAGLIGTELRKAERGENLRQET